MTWRIGVDIGGTFTDVALVEENSGRIGVAKVATTPADPAAGVLNALVDALEPLRGHPLRRLDSRMEFTRHGLVLRIIGDRLVFAPPLVTEEADIAEMATRLKRALDDVAGDLKREAALG